MRMFMPTFWCIPTLVLSGSAAAAGIALINSLGAIGGFIGPWIFGLSKDLTGGTAGVFLAFAALALCTSVLLLVARGQKEFAPRPEPAVALPTTGKTMAGVRG
jgi:nitrate/nitrite transporter NarK